MISQHTVSFISDREDFLNQNKMVLEEKYGGMIIILLLSYYCRVHLHFATLAQTTFNKCKPNREFEEARPVSLLMGLKIISMFCLCGLNQMCPRKL